MCGIFGAIGAPNNALLRSLAIVNRERGTHSLGFFASNGKMCKNAGDPLRLLREEPFGGFLETACKKCWFVAGHTRLATRGKKTKKNAHPYRYGRILGAHNGCVTAPKEYAVDSMYLFDLLREHGGDYQKALADVRGYWSLTWFDGRNLFIATHDNSVALARWGSSWYYSSDESHLRAALGVRPYRVLSDGDVVRFDLKSGGPVDCEPFRSSVVEPIYRDPRTDGKTDGKTEYIWEDDAPYWDCDECGMEYEKQIFSAQDGDRRICEYCMYECWGLIYDELTDQWVEEAFPQGA